jgi:hypothetical protein
MNNKIEKGCLAIVVAGRCSENIGKVVRVGDFVGQLPDSRLKDYWQVDKPMKFANAFGVLDGERYFNRECNLMRIDNYDQDVYTLEQIEQLEKEKVEWVY